ncbi:sugar transferase EpsL [Pseudovibrio denitrificans]|uniref:Sugar transferase EpsL n=1 Tax=Pseudovibrio denitrificans TaxID=258256 RepID=A0A1I7CMK9_9HYPH|nr:sugar transferase [Pseudovibrio denitrificans]SFU00680.1 sugar transferase EpsL [Pseudovibrio denitrificans]
MKYQDYKTRAFDIMFSLAVLTITLPILAITALLVGAKLGRPIIFKQTRTGQAGRNFQIYKLRSMTDECDEHGALLPDAERLTRFGKFLRAWSIDELPGFINVLKGDMSIVGPRPQLARFLELYSERQLRRHLVKPGITGWAQVNGRNSLDWESRFELDVWYVENKSFWLDLKIIFLTFIIVFRREGINAVGHATMPEFRGDEIVTEQFE